MRYMKTYTYDRSCEQTRAVGKYVVCLLEPYRARDREQP